ncbi:MAG: sulfatase [Verrucomicrobiota bacterium]
MRLFQSLAVIACLFGTWLPASDQPNIVIIFIDDQGYYDLGCYGATEIRTPRIDELAEQGIRFTDYYAAAPICSPSRAGLLTGCYPRRIGMEAWVQRADSKRGIHPDEITMAELLKENGYTTACVGKWHMGDKEPFLPHHQGFDFHYGLYSNLDPVEIIYFEDGKVPLMRDGEVIQDSVDPAELTKKYTDEAIAFVERAKDEPFFLYFPHTMLHVPLGVSEEFQGSSEWGEYGDAIQELDFHVGRFMDALEVNGLADETLVIYASDNGRGPGRTEGQNMQGRKLTTWECGIRVPALAWGPGLGVPQSKVSNEIVTAMDWYPTLATLAGISLGDDHPVIDGRDFYPLLIGESDVVPGADSGETLNAAVSLRRHWDQGLEWSPVFSREDYRNAFFYHGAEGGLAAVRSGDFKLTLSPGLALYNLREDPGETTPIRTRGEMKRLRGMAILFQEEMSLTARRPGFAP